ncbi:hypothetical protein FEM03_11520 [Phragmitibacter flavus]|uniref:Tetratricopeptide repeat protein n=1 Tax=Phragmitibacter flavus TaxID=2576071 RepID=A0A5R8KDM7_9BACT|nr:tetratricopeptide repeat protein [Phragmitibacter flavus]TLD70357.1 hypothetical protein FEM03_11520 [Phragmitibacter flavus]
MSNLLNLGSATAFGKFAANCVKIFNEVSPALVVGTVAAPATGGLSLVAALGAAGIAIADLYLDVSQGRELGSIKDSLDKMLSHQRTQANIAALSLTTLDEIKQLIETKTAPREAFQPLQCLLEKEPDLALSLNHLVARASEIQTAATFDAAAIIASNQEALLRLIQDPNLPDKCRQNLASLIGEIKTQLTDLHRGQQTLLTNSRTLSSKSTVTILMTLVIVAILGFVLVKLHQFELKQAALAIPIDRPGLGELKMGPVYPLPPPSPNLVPPSPTPFPTPANHNPAQNQPDLPPPVQAAFDNFETLDQLHDFDGLKKAADDLIHLAPRNARAWFLHGYAAFQLSKEHTVGPQATSLMQQSERSALRAVELIETTKQYQDFLASSLSNLGSARSELGELTEAETVLRRAVELEPHHIDAWLNLDHVYGQKGTTGKPQQLALLREAFAKNPDHPRIRERLLSELTPDYNRNYSNLHHQESLTLLDEIMRIETPNFGTLVTKFHLHLSLDQFDQAQGTLEKAVQLASHPLETVETILLKATLNKQLNPNHTVAEDPDILSTWPLIESAIKSTDKSTNAYPWFLATHYHSILGNIKKAKTYAAQIPPASEYYPRSKGAIIVAESNQYGLEIAALNNENLSATEIQNRVNLLTETFFNPQFQKENASTEGLSAFFSLVRDGQRLLLAEKWNDLLILSKSCALKHTEGFIFELAQFYIGFAHYQLDQYEEANQAFAAAIKHNQKLRKTVLPLYASSLFEANRLEEAEQAYRDALKLSPEDSSLVVNLCITLGKVNKPDEGIDLFRQYLSTQTQPLTSQDRNIMFMLLRMSADLKEKAIHTFTEIEPVKQTLARITQLYAEAAEFATDHERKHYAWAKEATSYSSLSAYPEWKSQIDTYLNKVRKSDPSFAETNPNFAGLTGSLLFWETSETGLESAPRHQLQSIRTQLEKAVQSPFRPLRWDINLAYTIDALGEPDLAIGNLETLVSIAAPMNFNAASVASVQYTILELYLYQALKNKHAWPSEQLRQSIERVEAIASVLTPEQVGADNWSFVGAIHHHLKQYPLSQMAYTKALELRPDHYADWIQVSDIQLRSLNFFEATVSSIQAYRMFPWRDRSIYIEMFPMLANLLMATSPATVPCLCLLIIAARRRSKSRNSGRYILP